MDVRSELLKKCKEGKHGIDIDLVVVPGRSDKVYRVMRL